ncbi:hypothetical protein AM499_07755 [Bacillus sp. FJAT-22090]|uniref:hypothetical protein n=1 Tax=Bacillus sp. FJAT-22090 TaxID=1581038 RepID=UPI0006AF4152|nr:hypothetical protein [Bacillus sp. FJAT-22090]ALC85728.1 hypothetical protein AM499_07755 [Bacillus sp. FJAT-22090]
MSGNAGIRGYYYQVLATLLDSVSDDDWDSVQIEPYTEDDKVDIEWIRKDSIKAVQVKSSINNFERSMVIDWIVKLVKDAKSNYGLFGLPIQYTLCLIGTTDNNADKFISALHGKRIKIADFPKLEEIKEELQYVTVDKRGFHLDDLINSSYFNMQQYLERNHKHTSTENVKMLCDIIISKLFINATKSRNMPKSLFIQLIDSFINSGEYGITETNKGSSNLSLAFYERGKVQENTEMNGIKLDILPILDELNTEALQEIRIAQSIHLPMQKIQKDRTANRETIDEDIEMSNSVFQAISKLNLYEFIPVEIGAQEKEELKQLSQELLQITLREEDFHFGDLKKRGLDIHLFGKPNNTPQGTKEEIEKYTAIDNAYYNLLLYKIMLEYNEYLQSCYPLPLILKNIGPLHDEDIRVTIKFPENVKVITPQRIKTPLYVVERFINEKEQFENLIVPQRDHKVVVYSTKNIIMPRLPKFSTPFKPAEYDDVDFKQFAKSIFTFEHFEEDGFDIIAYGFDRLNPNTNMQFPSFILVQTVEDFDLEYVIQSKHLKQPIQGVLNWIYPK